MKTAETSMRTPATRQRRGDRWWFWGLLAAPCVAGLWVFVKAHALGGPLALALVALFVAACGHARLAWLFWVPALMPMVDLAVWTGQIYLTESDALVLAAVIAFATRTVIARRGEAAPEPAELRFGPLQWLLVLLMLASYLLSTQWDALWSMAFDPNLQPGYAGALNGVRVSKAFLLPLLLLPLLLTSFRQEPAWATRIFSLGMVASLALVSLAAVAERLSFPGLSDFASDYRTTALFWEMNVGGAQLDGWLVMCLPFLMWALLREQSNRRLLGLSLVGLVAGYATFTTFSRGLYGGAVIGLSLTAALMARSLVARDGWLRIVWRVLQAGGLAAIVGWLLAGVFQTGGYRGLVAMLGLVLVAALALGPAKRAGWRVIFASAGLAGLLSAGSLALAAMLPKGAYLAYAFATPLVVVQLWKASRGETSSRQALAALTGLFWTAFNAALVAVHWGGGKAFAPALAASAVFAVGALMMRRHPAAAVRPSLKGLMTVAALLGLVALVVVSLNTYFASSRFGAMERDLAGRKQHWAESLALVTSDSQWLGIGTGQFAERYFWHVQSSAKPGNHQWLREEGAAFVRLGGPRHVLGHGELYRLTQRVSPELSLPLSVSISLRAPEGRAAIFVEVCRKHLLYTQGCLWKREEAPRGAAWGEIRMTLDGQELGSPGVLLPRATSISFANASGGQLLDVRWISVSDATGRELLRNERFLDGEDFWFFSSDRHHLPWHAKNLLLHFFVEQGWLGVVAFSLLVVAAAFRLLFGQGARHPLAPPVAGAIAGVIAVGMFDSLADAPRVGTLLFLLLFVALGLRVPSGRRLESGAR